MLTYGNVSAPIGHTRGLPVPGKPVPIRPVQRRCTSPFTSTAPAAPDPDAIARLERLGIVVVRDEVVDEKPVKVVTRTRRKRKRARQNRGGGTRRRLDIDPTALAAEYQAGATVAELAAKHHASDWTINSRLKDAGVRMRDRNERPKIPTERIIELHKKGLNHKQIAAEIGLSDVTVGNRLRAAGIRVGRVHVHFDEELAVEMARDGRTAWAISKVVGVCRTTVVDRLATHGITFETAVTRHLSDVPAMIRLAEEGKTITQIADTLEISERTVSTHLRRAGVVPVDGRIEAANARRDDITPELLAVDYRAGLNINEIAAKHRVSRATVRRRLATIPDLPRQAGGKHVTTPEVRQAVVADYLAGVNSTHVAEKHNLPRQTVEGILRRAGVTRRSAIEGAASISDLLHANGVTAADVRAWATAAGRDVTARGLPSRLLVEDYLLHHRTTATTTEKRHTA